MKMLTENDEILSGKFFRNGKFLEEGPVWAMSLKKAGSMRFRWNETNENRIKFLEKLEKDSCGVKKYSHAQVELIHSREVVKVNSPEDVEKVQADGIITINKEIIPVVTVADCMPIYLYDPVSGVFGMLHSGWKGTGILRNALEKAEKEYNARAEDFSVVMGPHIHSCCYKVEGERAAYFRDNFTPDCVSLFSSGEKGELYSLSLADANLKLALDCGIKKENIFISPYCTCCNEAFGSFRRENPVKGSFTVQSAWVKW